MERDGRFGKKGHQRKPTFPLVEPLNAIALSLNGKHKDVDIVIARSENTLVRVDKRFLIQLGAYAAQDTGIVIVAGLLYDGITCRNPP